MVYRYILVIIGLILVTYAFSLKVEVSRLSKRVTELQANVAYKALETERLKAAVIKYNSAVQAMKIDKNKLRKELQLWKKKKLEIRYKTITKIREVQSDKCKDIKNVINNVRHINYHEL